MAQRSFSTSDLSRKSGDIIAEALQHPVTITQRNKPRLVVMNIDAFEEMRRRADPRRAMTIEQVANEYSSEELEASLAAYLAAANEE